jgi:hypothetical protein
MGRKRREYAVAGLRFERDQADQKDHWGQFLDGVEGAAPATPGQQTNEDQQNGKSSHERSLVQVITS